MRKQIGESMPSTSSKKSKALVIGVSPDNTDDKKRFDGYFQSLNMDWETTSVYFTRDKTLDIKSALKNPKDLFCELIELYQKTYLQHIGEMKKGNAFNLIMLDRATTHGLVIDNPLGENIEELSKDEKAKFYSLSSTQNRYLTDIDGGIGRFNKGILCLLFYHFLALLKPGAGLIIDAAYLEPQHIDVLALFFTKHEAWDYNAPPNNKLDYAPGYESGMYLKPNFIKFCGYKNNNVTIDLQSKLLEHMFPADELKEQPPERKRSESFGSKESLDTILKSINFEKYIDEIEQKTQQFQVKHTKAYEAAQRLIDALNNAKTEFQTQKSNISTFKNACTDAITDSKGELQKHRALWSKLLHWIVKMGTLGLYRMNQERGGFFKTKSSEILERLEKDVSRLDSDTPPIDKK